MKRKLIYMLALLALISALWLSAQAGTTGDLTWTVDSAARTLTITGTGAMPDYDYELAEDRYDVDVITYPWLNVLSYFDRVVIGEGVTRVGANAFHACTNVTSVSLPSTLEFIGASAFELTHIASVSVPSGVTTIGSSAFYSCKQLKNLTLSEGLQTIGDSAFSKCTGLTDVQLPDSLGTIGGNAFYGCTGLTGIQLPDALGTIGGSAFYGCTGIEKVTIPASVTAMSPNSFPYTTALNFEMEAAGVTGDVAWYVLGNQLVIRGAGAMADHLPYEWRDDGDWYDRNGAPWYRYHSNFESIMVCEGVTAIGQYAFYKLSPIQSVSLPRSLMSIREGAFMNCGVPQLTVPTTVTYIGPNAFSGISNIRGLRALGQTGDLAWRLEDGNLSISGTGPMPDYTYHTRVDMYDTNYPDTPWHNLSGYIVSVTVQPGVTHIGNNAFYGLYGATMINIPTTVTSMGTNAFEDCNAVEKVNYCETGQTVQARQWGYIQFANPAANPLSQSGKALLYINNALMVMAYYTTDADSVGNYAFYNCQNEFYAISNGGYTGEIGDYAFYNCKNLTGAEFTTSVTHVGHYAFYGCERLSSLYRLADGLTYIGDYAFCGCNALAGFNMCVDANRAMTYFGEYAFKNCPNLTSFVMGKTDAVPYGCFMNDSLLASVTLPSGLETIGSYAFDGCGMTALTLPVGVNDILSYAFYQNTRLATVSFIGAAPGTIGDNAFGNVTATVTYRPGDSWNGKLLNYGGNLTWAPAGGACGDNARWALDDVGVLTLSGSGRVTSGPWSAWVSEINAVTLAEGARFTDYSGGAFTGITGAYVGSCGDSAAWLIAPNGTLTITGEGDMADYGDNTQPWFDHTEITAVDVRDGITGIGACAFSGAAYSLRLSAVTLADSVKRIGAEAFYNSVACDSVALPADLEQIGQRAFSGAALTAVSLPANVNYIAPDAFKYTRSLAGFSVAEGNESFAAPDGVLYTADMSKLVHYPARRSGATYVIPEGVEAVGAYALSSDDACPLGTLVFPATLERLEGSVMESPDGSAPAKLVFLGGAPAADKAFGYSRADAYYTRIAKLTDWSDTTALGGGLTWHFFCAWSDEGIIDNCSMETVDEVPAGCEATGVAAHERCSVCGLRITGYGAWVTDDAMLTLPATGHAYGEPAFRRTGDGEGFEAVFTCEGCENEVVAAAEQTADSELIVEPGCTTEGVRLWHLTATIGDEAHEGTLEETVPALGHDPVTDEAAEPTCTEPGLTEGSHCARCEAILTPQEPVPELGHEPVTVEAVEPTCMEPGLTEGSHCGRCDAVLIPQETVTALGHDPVTDEAVAPTCTEPGLTEGSHCARCEAVLTPQEPVPALGHEPEIIPAVPATRTATGLTEGERCGVCGEILTAQQEIPMLSPLLTPDFVVPSGVTVIDEEAFTGIAATAVALPEGVTSIGDRAFAGCTALQQIQIPGSVKHIGEDAFDGCAANLLIVGEFDTPAETYARENGIAFQDAEGHEEKPE